MPAPTIWYVRVCRTRASLGSRVVSRNQRLSARRWACRSSSDGKRLWRTGQDIWCSDMGNCCRRRYASVGRWACCTTLRPVSTGCRIEVGNGERCPAGDLDAAISAGPRWSGISLSTETHDQANVTPAGSFSSEKPIANACQNVDLRTGSSTWANLRTCFSPWMYYFLVDESRTRLSQQRYRKIACAILENMYGTKNRWPSQYSFRRFLKLEFIKLRVKILMDIRCHKKSKSRNSETGTFFRKVMIPQYLSIKTISRNTIILKYTIVPGSNYQSNKKYTVKPDTPRVFANGFYSPPAGP